MKKAFVTGARGFIGQTLIKRLKQDGIPYVRYDAKDGNYLNNFDRLVMMMSECDFVFHLAANADISKGWEHPRRDFEINTDGTLSVLEAMRVNNISGLGFASSSAVYGEA